MGMLHFTSILCGTMGEGCGLCVSTGTECNGLLYFCHYLTFFYLLSETGSGAICINGHQAGVIANQFYD